MPLFDVRCRQCQHDTEVYAPSSSRLPACVACGAEVERLWSPSVHVRQDSIPGGMVIENMGPTPITVYSHSEYRLEMKRRGLVNKVQHVGVPGTDKSPMTTRWT